MTTSNSPMHSRLLRAATEVLKAALKPAGDVVMHDESHGRIQLSQGEQGRTACKIALRPWSDYVDAKRPQREAQILWVTRRADARTRDLLRHEDRNFIDVATRTAHLRLPGLLLDRSGVRTERSLRTSGRERNPYSELGSLISRTLLAEIGRIWTLNELSSHAGTKLALTSRVIDYAVKGRLVESRRSGQHLSIVLRNPWPLFLEWTRQYRWTDNVALEVAAPVGDTERFLARLDSIMRANAPGTEWGLTLQAGASRIVSHAEWNVIHAYVECRTLSDLEGLAGRMQWKESRQGRLVLLAPRYRHAVWWGLSRRGKALLPVVHPVQLMLDLWHYPLRGREQAERLGSLLGWPPVET
jgi:hypothetical protein